jgi:catechol 2,3-dioxygenase-like lactoylglutathione lyase family enzyme
MKQHPAVIALGVVAVALFLVGGAPAGREVKSADTGGDERSDPTRKTPVETLPLRGIAHVGIQVSDLDKSRGFYHQVLGFEEVFDLRTPDRQEVAVAFFKINDQQYIELFAGLRPEQPSPIRYVALCTDDIEKLHQMLQLRGVTPGPIGEGREGNLKFSITNPPGLELSSLDFVQYARGSLHSAAVGKGLSDRRIGARVNHLGLVASDLVAGKKFCIEALDFREGNAKRRSNGTVYAEHLNLPGSSGEYFELSARPSQFDRHQGGIKAHLCLTAPDAAAAYQLAVDRGATLEPVQSTRGKQEKFPFLLFDPDHSRVEFMPPKKAAP